MKLIQVQGQVGRAEGEAAEVLVLLHCEGVSGFAHEAAAIDAQLGGQLSKLIKRGEFEGNGQPVKRMNRQGRPAYVDSPWIL